MQDQSSDIRRWHYITRNIRTSVPTACLFFDTETTGIPIAGAKDATLQVLSLWHAVFVRLEKGKVRSRKHYHGTTCEAFWTVIDGLLNPRRPLWIFAHNIGFDLTVLQWWKELETGRYSIEPTSGEIAKARLAGTRGKWHGLAVIDDPPVIFQCLGKQNTSSLIAVDTYNYWRCSVAKLGESIGLPKLELPDYPCPQEQLDAYCYRDVEIIEKAITSMMQLIVSEDLGMWRFTAPAQAFSAYRHRFMREKILVHGNKDALQLEREAYYGGRCEPLYIGYVVDKDRDTKEFLGIMDKAKIICVAGPVYVLDIQSAYPAVMLWRQFPAKIKAYVVQPSLLEVREKLQTHCVIARVTIRSFQQTYPYRHDGRTEFCTGQFVTSLCGPELKRACECGNVLNVDAVAYYTQADLFSEYVSYFWNKRKEYKEQGNEVGEQWCKLMLNSLAGKFGQRRRRWIDREDVVAPIPFGNWTHYANDGNLPTCYRSIAWAVQSEQDAGESIDSCPAIAAYVTAYQRERLLELMNIADVDNTFYVDTDCLHVNEAGLLNLTKANQIVDGKLGMLRLCGTYETAEYRGIKDYTIGDNTVIAGIKLNAEQVSNGIYRQPKFQKLRSILAGPPPQGVRVDMVDVDRRRGLDPLRIGGSGRVIPQRII